MATTEQIVKYLRPNGGWVLYGDDISTMIFDEGVQPITKSEFNAAAKIVDAELASEEKSKSDAKAALLNRLGITAEEANLLLQ
jgi:hypothetical protein